MSQSDQEKVPEAPGAGQVLLSLLLLVLFMPVILAVGSADFRPAWLGALLAGFPVGIVWVVGSICLFVLLTWLFARMVFTRMSRERGE